jgi:hypothetical protein
VKSSCKNQQVVFDEIVWNLLEYALESGQIFAHETKVFQLVETFGRFKIPARMTYPCRFYV